VSLAVSRDTPAGSVAGPDDGAPSRLDASQRSLPSWDRTSAAPGSSPVAKSSPPRRGGRPNPLSSSGALNASETAALSRALGPRRGEEEGEEGEDDEDYDYEGEGPAHGSSRWSDGGAAGGGEAGGGGAAGASRRERQQRLRRLHRRRRRRVPYFVRIGKDLEIVKVVLLLTGAFHGTRNAVARYLQQFAAMSWLWRGEPGQSVARFLRRQPSTGDFDAELVRLSSTDAEVGRVLVVHVIGALALNTSTLKQQLLGLNAQWKRRLADQLHVRARESLEDLTSYMGRIGEALGREVTDLEALYELAEVLKEVREGESAIEGRIGPVLERYAVLRRHLPGVYEDTAELDAQATLRRQWERLADRAEEVSDSLAERQAGFKGELLTRARALTRDVAAFRAEFEARGPMERGLQPAEAVSRILRVRAELSGLQRRLADVRRGEKLFALRPTPFPQLERTQRELRLATLLFELCVDAEKTAQDFAATPWSKATPAVPVFASSWHRLEARHRRLPQQTRAWAAHRRLGQLLAHFRAALPSLELLVRPQIRPWHWRSVMRVLRARWPMEALFQTQPTQGSDAIAVDVYPSAAPAPAPGAGGEVEARLARDGVLRVGELVARDMASHAADVEDIADTADKQAVIGSRVSELRQRWWQRGLDFERWREREDVVVLARYSALLEELEEAQMQAQTLLSMRQVEPYRDATLALLRQLSDISDTLSLWLRVQELWQSLESVFVGTDIARQLPADSRRFARADREWAAVMSKAEELHTVTACTSSDVVRNTLPRLLDAFERARQRLEGYLELKRSQLPRLFLVSDQALLTLLSKGSDPMAVQPLYGKLFEAVSRVVHARPTARAGGGGSGGDGDASKGGAPRRIFGPIVTLVNTWGSSKSDGAGGAVGSPHGAMARAARQEREELRLSEGCEVEPEGPTEEWLLRLQRSMQASVHDACGEVAEAALGGLAPRRLAALFPAQMAVVGLQLQWADAVTRALDLTVAGQRSALADALKRQTSVLSDLSELSLDVAAAQHASDAAAAASRAGHPGRGGGGLASGGPMSRLGGAGRRSTPANDPVLLAAANNPVGPARELRSHAGADESMLRGLLKGLPGPMSRTKAETLVTLQLHHRDVVQELFRRHRERKLAGTDDFEFTRRARVQWSPDEPNPHSPHVGSGALRVCVADVTMPCCYEWLGVTSRLVITPLTDRAYLAFSQASGMQLGLAPSGPAGTGKTETVKDLARLLNAPCIVTNCSEQMMPHDVARVLKGLAGAGAVGCFDEFNRLLVGALSVAAEQFGALTHARRAGAVEFTLPGDARPSALQPRTVHYAVTMNPRGKDYAGRSELPDNLKALFRPVAMMVPDRETILRVRLCALGFRDFPGLASRLDAVFTTAQRTLSPQRHYDWGLRGVLAVIGSAGSALRALAAAAAEVARRQAEARLADSQAAAVAQQMAGGGEAGGVPGLALEMPPLGGPGGIALPAEAVRPSAEEEQDAVRDAVRSANVGKLVPADVPLLEQIIRDVFDEARPPHAGAADRRRGGAAAGPSAPAAAALEAAKAVRSAAVAQGLTPHAPWLAKCAQLQGALAARHAVAVIGAAGTGKTCATDVVAAARSAATRARGGKALAVRRMAPKALAAADLFGVRDARGGEWIPGVFACLWAAANTAASPCESWLVLDGPVDPRWVEDLNSVMDDTKTLTLSNGERIPMLPSTRLLLEAADMANASPATVSRAGIVFFGERDLGWEPVVDAWLVHQPAERAEHVRALFRRYVTGDRRALVAAASDPSDAAFAPGAATRPQPTVQSTGEWRSQHASSRGIDPGLARDPGLLADTAVPARLAASASLAREEGGCLFFFLRRFTSPATGRSPLAVVSTLLCLLTALLRDAGLAEAVEAEAAALAAFDGDGWTDGDGHDAGAEAPWGVRAVRGVAWEDEAARPGQVADGPGGAGRDADVTDGERGPAAASAASAAAHSLLLHRVRGSPRRSPPLASPARGLFSFEPADVRRHEITLRGVAGLGGFPGSVASRGQGDGAGSLVELALTDAGSSDAAATVSAHADGLRTPGAALRRAARASVASLPDSVARHAAAASIAALREQAFAPYAAPGDDPATAAAVMEEDAIERAFLLALAWAAAGDLVTESDRAALDAFLRSTGAPLPQDPFLRPGDGQEGAATEGGARCGGMCPQAAELAARHGPLGEDALDAASACPGSALLAEEGLIPGGAPGAAGLAVVLASSGGVRGGAAPSVFDLCLELSGPRRWDLWSCRLGDASLPRQLGIPTPHAAVSPASLFVPTPRLVAAAGVAGLLHGLGAPVALVGPRGAGRSRVAGMVMARLAGQIVDFAEAEGAAAGRFPRPGTFGAGRQSLASPSGGSPERSTADFPSDDEDEADEPGARSPRAAAAPPLGRRATSMMRSESSSAGLAASLTAGGLPGAGADEEEGASSTVHSWRSAVFSAATDHTAAQAAVEACLERRGGKTFGPAGGSSSVLTLVIEDVGRPAADDWGSKPALEVLRHLVASGSLPFLAPERRGEWKAVAGLLLLATLTVPAAGGRAGGRPGGSSSSVLERAGSAFASSALATGDTSGSGSLLGAALPSSAGGAASSVPPRLLRLLSCVSVPPADAADLVSVLGPVVTARFFGPTPTGLSQPELPSHPPVGVLARLPWLATAVGVGRSGPLAHDLAAAIVASAVPLATAMVALWTDQAAGATPSRPTGGAGIDEALRVAAGVCRVPVASLGAADAGPAAELIATAWRHEIGEELIARLPTLTERHAAARAAAAALGLAVRTSSAMASVLAERHADLAAAAQVAGGAPSPARSLPRGPSRVARAAALGVADAARAAAAAALAACMPGADAASLGVSAAELEADGWAADPRAAGAVMAAAAPWSAPAGAARTLLASAGAGIARLASARARLAGHQQGGAAAGGAVAVLEALGATDRDARCSLALPEPAAAAMVASWVARGEATMAGGLVGGALSEASLPSDTGSMVMLGDAAWAEDGADVTGAAHGRHGARGAGGDGETGYDVIAPFGVVADEEPGGAAAAAGVQAGRTADEAEAEREAAVAAASSVGRASAALQALLEAHNVERPREAIRAVLFPDAVRGAAACARAVQTPGRHAVLVGTAGSGRRTVARLGAIAAGADVVMDSAGGVMHVGGKGEVDEAAGGKAGGGGDAGGAAGGGSADAVTGLLAEAVRVAAAGRTVVVLVTDSDVCGLGVARAAAATHAVAALCGRQDVTALFSKDEQRMLLSALAPAAAKAAAQLETLEAEEARAAARGLGAARTQSSRSALSVAGSAASVVSTTAAASAGGRPSGPEDLALGLLRHRVRSRLTVVLVVEPDTPLPHLVLGPRASALGAPLAALFESFPLLRSASVVVSVRPWPRSALARLAARQLDALVEMGGPPAGADDDHGVAAGAEGRGSLPRRALAWHMASTHLSASAPSASAGRSLAAVAHTPRSFLAYASEVVSLLAGASASLAARETQLRRGVERLDAGARGVEALREDLGVSETELRRSEAAVGEAMEGLRGQTVAAEAERGTVEELRSKLAVEAAATGEQKAQADTELSAAMPFFRRAEEAVAAISSADIAELKGMTKPKDVVKVVLDAVLLTLGLRVDRVKPAALTLGAGREKVGVQFLADSFVTAKRGALADAGFLKLLLRFGQERRDDIPDETEELLQPYLSLPGLASVRSVSKAADGLLTWVRALMEYREASRDVKPRIEALRVAEVAMAAAQSRLDAASEKLRVCDERQAALQATFEACVAEREGYERRASSARRKIKMAEALLAGLAGERARWVADADAVAIARRRAPGDAAVAAAVSAYAGPLSPRQRNRLVSGPLGVATDLLRRGIELSPDLLPPLARQRVRAELGAGSGPVLCAAASRALVAAHEDGADQPLPAELASRLLGGTLEAALPGWTASGLPTNGNAVLSGALAERAVRSAVSAVTGSDEAAWSLARRAAAASTGTLAGEDAAPGRAQGGTDEAGAEGPTDVTYFEAVGHSSGSLVGRFPVLVDPQGQAVRWVRAVADAALRAESAARVTGAQAAAAEARRREQRGLPPLRAHTAAAQLLASVEAAGGVVPGLEPVELVPSTSPRLLDAVMGAMERGRPIVVTGVDSGGGAVPAAAPPQLLPLLEGRTEPAGRRLVVTLGGGEGRSVEALPGFALHLVASSPSARLSAGLQGLCACVDFGVSEEGLEEQLLGRTLAREQAAAEARLRDIEAETVRSREDLLRLQGALLSRLAESTGDLLSNDSLVTVLRETKRTADAVADRLKEAESTRERLGERREGYRAAARRGSLLFFAWRACEALHPAYGASLERFLAVFDEAMEVSAAAGTMTRRAGAAGEPAAADVDDPDADVPPGAVAMLGGGSGLAAAPATAGSVSRRVQSITHAATALVVSRAGRAMSPALRVAFRLDVALRLMEREELLPAGTRQLLLAGGGGGGGGGGGTSADAAGSSAAPGGTSGLRRPWWMPEASWARTEALSARGGPTFASLARAVSTDDEPWRQWFDAARPEDADPPAWDGCDSPTAASRAATGAGAVARGRLSWALQRLLVASAARPDRTEAAARVFLRCLRWLPPRRGGSGKAAVPGMGPGLEVVAADAAAVTTLTAESGPGVPVLLLLADGADASAEVETAARRARVRLEVISLGGGRDASALTSVRRAAERGHWVLVQNAHLAEGAARAIAGAAAGAAAAGGFAAAMLAAQEDGGGGGGDGGAAGRGRGDAGSRGPATSPSFRVIVTASAADTAATPLLAAVSVTASLEAPSSLRGALHRSVTSGPLTQELLDRVDGPEWRRLCWSLVFLHAAALARRAYGPLGWARSYAFDEGDLVASLAFAERRIFALGPKDLSFPALQTLTADVLMGGRVSDSRDGMVLRALTSAWVVPHALGPGFSFAPSSRRDGAKPSDRSPDLSVVYRAVDADVIGTYRARVAAMPDPDAPEALGLHGNAGLAATETRSRDLLRSLETLTPLAADGGADGGGDAAAGPGPGRGRAPPRAAGPGRKPDGLADRGAAAVRALRDRLPSPLSQDDVSSALRRIGPEGHPLAAFAIAEVRRVAIIEGAARAVVAALEELASGAVAAPTPALEEAAAAVRVGRTPRALLAVAEGVSSALAGDWSSGDSAAAWFEGLAARSAQARAWALGSRPHSVWFGGLLAPQAFAAAVCHDGFLFGPRVRAQAQTLDRVSLHGEVTAVTNPSDAVALAAPPGEGVLVHGMVLHGAAWSAAAGGLVDRPSRPQVLHEALPVVSLVAVPDEEARRAATRAGPTAPYDCPVYASPERGDKALVCCIALPSREQRPQHWLGRGVAILLRDP